MPGRVGGRPTARNHAIGGGRSSDGGGDDGSEREKRISLVLMLIE